MKRLRFPLWRSISPTLAPSRLFSLHPLMRLAVGVWLALIIGVSLRVAFASVYSGTVFPIYSVSAERWCQGKNLYDHGTSNPYRYHPAVAVSFVPWTLLPNKVAAIVWRWLGVGLLLWGLFLWMRQFLQQLSSRRQAIFLILVTPLALQSVNNAQINAHLTAILLLGLVAAARQLWTISAILLAAAALFKLYPVVIGLLMMAAFPRRFAWRYLLALAAGFALPFLTQASGYVLDQYRHWVEYLQGDTRFGASLDVASRDFELLMRVYFKPITEMQYRFIEAGLGALIATLCLLVQRRPAGPSDLFTSILQLGCIWMTVFGPATESNTYTLLGPTAAILLTAPPPGRSRWAWSLLIIGYALMVVATLATAFPGGKRVQEFALQPAGGLLLLVVVVAELLRAIRSNRNQGREK